MGQHKKKQLLIFVIFSNILRVYDLGSRYIQPEP
jgi:hypothetical protein